MLFVFGVEIVAGIEGRFFEGPQNRRIPRYSLTDFDGGLFRCVCILIKMDELLLNVL